MSALRLPVSEEVVWTSTRKGGNVLELRLCDWGIYETATVTLLSNGRMLHVAVRPGEISGLIEALAALAERRGWR